VTGYDEVTVAAGILHDAVRDTEADVETIEEQFGGDKVAKVRELRAQAGADRGLLARDEAGQRLRHYEESLVMLEYATPEHPLVCQLRFELEALQALPPHYS
jgi:(p)ppGpp synthase/HD superfamily hydrolase